MKIATCQAVLLEEERRKENCWLENNDQSASRQIEHVLNWVRLTNAILNTNNTNQAVQQDI